MLLLLGAAAGTLLSQTDGKVDFEPRVGMVGTRVVVKTPIPPGASLRFGTKVVAFARETPATAVFLVPPAASSSFIEIVREGKVIAKSAVPFVVSGASVAAPRLIGLKEAIDVFAFQDDPTPEGGRKPETPVKPILRFGESDVITIGETPPAPGVLAPVTLGDLSSAARGSLGPSAFIITARPPVKRIQIPTPTPTPTPPAPSSAPPAGS